MNYDKARQVDPTADRSDAGKWRYTSGNHRSGTHATGACSPYLTCGACNGWGSHWQEHTRTHEPCVPCVGKGYQDLGDAACPGHDTAEEAYAHQTEYLLDHIRCGQMSNQMLRCQAPECSAYSEHYAEVGQASMFILCDAHRTREVVAELFGTAGEVWHS